MPKQKIRIGEHQNNNDKRKRGKLNNRKQLMVIKNKI